jgi:vancomycin aglycone glucosyltransferase
MRVVIAAEGTRGDVYPMLALARSLLAAGHTVRLCAPPDFAAEVRATGAEFVSLQSEVRAFISASAPAIHGGAVAMMREMGRWGALSLATQFSVLPDAVAGSDFVIGAGTIIGGASAAERHGVPYRAVVYTPAVLPSAEHTPCVWPLQLRSRRLNRALWWLAGGGLELALRRPLNRARASIGLAPVRAVLPHILSPRPLLAVDRPLAPAPSDCPVEVEQVRCLHPETGGSLPEKLESFLAAGPPPVYFGFGSMPDPDPRATTRRLLAAVESLGCRAIVSAGWAGLGEGPLPEGVIAIGAVDHASLFPRMAAVVHHGGSGTTHSAARAGVPQLVVPHVLDQFWFARRVVELGVGVAAPRPARLDERGLVARLGALLDNEWLAERARALAAELRALGTVEPDLARVLAR